MGLELKLNPVRLSLRSHHPTATKRKHHFLFFFLGCQTKKTLESALNPANLSSQTTRPGKRRRCQRRRKNERSPERRSEHRVPASSMGKILSSVSLTWQQWRSREHICVTYTSRRSRLTRLASIQKATLQRHFRSIARAVVRETCSSRGTKRARQ